MCRLCSTGFVLVLIFLSSAPMEAATIHVPDDFPTIQAAIDAAAEGDTVLVAPGTYEENIDFIGKNITVKSTVFRVSLNGTMSSTKLRDTPWVL